MNRLSVQAKIIGRRGPSLASLDLELNVDLRTIRDLLAAVVRQQIVDFQKRKQEARLLRVLTEREIECSQASGKILSGDQEADQRIPDLEQSIDAVMTAFEDGLYYVFVNNVQVKGLEETLTEKPTDVLFIRLTPLVGG